MATLTLGSDPIDMVVKLTAGADFSHVLRRSDASSFPSNASMRLVFITATESIVWEATLVTTDATFAKDKVDVDALIAAKPKRAQLWYVEGDADVLVASAKKVTVNR